MVGGVGADDEVRRDGEVYDSAAERWEALAGLMPVGRGMHALVAVAGGTLAIGDVGGGEGAASCSTKAAGSGSRCRAQKAGPAMTVNGRGAEVCVAVAGASLNEVKDNLPKEGKGQFARAHDLKVRGPLMVLAAANWSPLALSPRAALSPASIPALMPSHHQKRVPQN